MDIQTRVYNKLIAIDDIINIVWIDNVHLQANDEHSNDYKINSPMITYAEVATSYSKVKKYTIYQITVWSKSKRQANSIAENIFEAYDMRHDTDYHYSRISQRNPIYDFAEKMNWTALTLNIIARK